MTMDEKYPLLIGCTGTAKTELHSIKEVAEFICKNGRSEDLKILTPSGMPFITTFGFFLDKIADLEYRTELLKILIPMQQEIEKGIFEGTDEERIELELADYLESEQYETDAAIEIRWRQENGERTPSREYIEELLKERKRTELEKAIKEANPNEGF